MFVGLWGGDWIGLGGLVWFGKGGERETHHIPNFRTPPRKEEDDISTAPKSEFILGDPHGLPSFNFDCYWNGSGSGCCEGCEGDGDELGGLHFEKLGFGLGWSWVRERKKRMLGRWECGMEVKKDV